MVNNFQEIDQELAREERAERKRKEKEEREREKELRREEESLAPLIEDRGDAFPGQVVGDDLAEAVRKLLRRRVRVLLRRLGHRCLPRHSDELRTQEGARQQ